MTEQGIFAVQWLGPFADGVFASLKGLFGPNSRFYLPYLAVAVLIAVAANFANRRHLGQRGKGGIFSGLFEPAIYFSRSSLVDLKVVLANKLFSPFLGAISRAATIIAAHSVATLVAGPDAANPNPETAAGAALIIAATLAVTMASDLTTYFLHRIHHENPTLWPFHKLHHSAETMTPLTFARKHPVYDLLRAASNAFIVGPVQGLIFALFGITSFAVIFGVSAFYAIFFWSGANLRHSHIWLSYGPVLSRILISPAQHQIHHSCAVRHHDKNYGEIFALWDWMFGTLYVPKDYEELKYGVADAQGQPLEQAHPTLRHAYLVPFQESLEAIKAGRTQPLKSPTPTATS